jgi:hypothetical protein
LLEVRAREAQGATLAESKAPDPLREAALHTRPQRLLSVERGGGLPVARRLERLVVRLRPDGEVSRGIFRRGTHPAHGTRTTGGPVKPDTNHRIARDSTPRAPIDTGMPWRTVCLLGVPIPSAGLQVIAVFVLMWLAIGPPWRPHDSDLMRRLSGDQEVGIHIATIK